MVVRISLKWELIYRLPHHAFHLCMAGPKRGPDTGTPSLVAPLVRIPHIILHEKWKLSKNKSEKNSYIQILNLKLILVKFIIFFFLS